MMTTSKIYKITWGGNGRIRWDLLSPAGDTEVISKIASNAIPLTQSLEVFNVGLNLVNVGLSVPILAKVSKIDEKMDKVNAKFDLLFLDKSLDYFLLSCRQSLGKENLIVLENDLLNALGSLETTGDLRIPAFLSHKIYQISEGLAQLNETLYTLLHNGALPRVSSKELKLWIDNKGADIDLLPAGGFSTQAEILKTIETCFEKKEKAFLDHFKAIPKTKRGIIARALSNDQFLSRSHPLVLMLREIRLFDTLQSRMEKPLMEAPENIIYLKIPNGASTQR